MNRYLLFSIIVLLIVLTYRGSFKMGYNEAYRECIMKYDIIEDKK